MCVCVCVCVCECVEYTIVCRESQALAAEEGVRIRGWKKSRRGRDQVHFRTILSAQAIAEVEEQWTNEIGEECSCCSYL